MLLRVVMQKQQCVKVDQFKISDLGEFHYWLWWLPQNGWTIHDWTLTK